MACIVFSHANSFPAGTYRVLFDELRERGFRVSAIERYGHDEKYPVSNNWPHLVQHLADFAAEQQQRSGEQAGQRLANARRGASDQRGRPVL